MKALHYSLYSGTLISISNARRGLSGVICPSCHNKLRARVDGDDKRFTHVGAECEYGYDVSVAMLACAVLNEVFRVLIPSAYGEEYKVIRVGFSRTEFTLGNDIPIIHTTANEKNLYISIKTEHRLNGRALYIAKSRQLPLLEIDLSSIHDISKDKIKSAILNDTRNKYWVYNRLLNSFSTNYVGNFL